MESVCSCAIGSLVLYTVPLCSNGNASGLAGFFYFLKAPGVFIFSLPLQTHLSLALRRAGGDLEKEVWCRLCCKRTDMGHMRVRRESRCALWGWHEPYFDQSLCPFPVLNPAPLHLSLHSPLIHSTYKWESPSLGQCPLISVVLVRFGHSCNFFLGAAESR